MLKIGYLWIVVQSIKVFFRASNHKNGIEHIKGCTLKIVCKTGFENIYLYSSLSL